jgi:hypothetical protein
MTTSTTFILVVLGGFTKQKTTTTNMALVIVVSKLATLKKTKMMNHTHCLGLGGRYIEENTRTMKCNSSWFTRLQQLKKTMITSHSLSLWFLEVAPKKTTMTNVMVLKFSRL